MVERTVLLDEDNDVVDGAYAGRRRSRSGRRSRAPLIALIAGAAGVAGTAAAAGEEQSKNDAK
jgi:hypothetical protein